MVNKHNDADANADDEIYEHIGNAHIAVMVFESINVDALVVKMNENHCKHKQGQRERATEKKQQKGYKRKSSFAPM